MAMEVLTRRNSFVSSSADNDRRTQAEACWTGIPVATTQGEQSYIKGNTKYMAVAVQVGLNV